MPPPSTSPFPSLVGLTTSAAPNAARPRPKFPPDAAGFQAALKKRVDAYFAAGRRERDCWQMYLKTAVILAWVVGSYALLVFWAGSLWTALPLATVMAMGMAAAAFCIQHDGGHHAYSSRPWVNRLAATSLDMIGASSYFWKWKHTVFHHTYSNVAGHDADIEQGPLVRFTPHQKRRPFHRFQHLYLWPLYGLTASRWHLIGDFTDWANGKVGPHTVPRPKGWDVVLLLAGKAFSIGWLLALPMVFHPWWVVVGVYLFATSVLGVVMSVVFQLAHCVEEADFPVPSPGDMRMADAWAVHQAQTTVDFARGSRVLSWLLGGLNFQIEHHLFPKVCHVHYPALSKIVEQTCREYGVQYADHGSFWDGMKSHYRWLRDLGRVDNPR